MLVLCEVDSTAFELHVCDSSACHYYQQMDAAGATLLAAAISALVAAGTFATAEIIKLRAAARDRRFAAFDDLFEALERVPATEMKSRWYRRASVPDLDIASRTMRLISVLPHRDRFLVYWLAERAIDLSTASGDDRVRISADMYSTILVWGSKPKPLMAKLEREVRLMPRWSENLGDSGV